MAFSQSLRKGQFPIVCHLCEVDMKIKWKCEDCDLLMCDRCREKVHPKFKRASDHSIINITKIGIRMQDTDRSFDLRDVKCKQHLEQNCCLFCQTCEQLICASCVTKSHKPHEFVEIQEACNINKRRLMGEKVKLETELLQLVEIETRAEQVKNIETSRYEKTKQEIFEQQKDLKNEVDKYANDLLGELDGSLQNLDKSLQMHQTRVDKLREVLQKRLTLTCNALDERDAITALEEGNGVFKSVDQIDKHPFYLQTTSVSKLVPSSHRIGEYFGLLQNTADNFTDKNICRIKRKFTTSANMINVHWIASATNGLWIGHNTTPNDNLPLVQKVTAKNNVLKADMSFDVNVYGMALNSDEDLLLCVDESKLKIINGKTGQVSYSKYNISPLVTRAVCVTKNNQIIIAAKNEGTPFPVSGRRAVIVMNEEGMQTDVYEFDTRKKRLFTYPSNITTNCKGNLFVLDMISKERHSRIVVLEPGRVDPLNVYSGCSEVNSERFPFKSLGLTHTASGRVITTDSCTHTLHILNDEGYITSLVHLRDIGVVDKPHSLAVNSSGTIYLGCTRYKKDLDTANLYELEYSDC